jgi:hypothetical protein
LPPRGGNIKLRIGQSIWQRFHRGADMTILLTAVGVAGWSGSLLRWDRELTGLKERLAPVFCRSEVRQSVTSVKLVWIRGVMEVQIGIMAPMEVMLCA